jgi:hypothetical protein
VTFRDHLSDVQLADRHDTDHDAEYLSSDEPR